MKNALFAIFSCFVIWAPAPSASADPVSSFKAFVNSAREVTEDVSVRQVGDKSSWAKVYWSVRDVKYDVRKTDSLVNPIFGSVSLVMDVRSSREYESESEARKSKDKDHNKIVSLLQARYHLEGRQWQAVQATMDFEIEGLGARSVELSREDRPNEDSPQNRLVNRWLPGFYR